MNTRPAGIAAAVLFAASRLQARDVTIDERLAAQTAIERVYYAHQLSASRPFDVVVPAAVIREKVARALKLSLALERFWKTTVTAEMLDAEVERMQTHTRMPERLSELFGALGDDRVMIRECLARPALVERLSRSFFAEAPPRGAGTWDEWWASVEPSLDGSHIAATTNLAAAPIVRAVETCAPPDSWDPGSLDDGPDARSQATAVWTGSRMIVWGGQRGSNDLGAGFRYDPATDSWEGITTLAAPDQRSGHVAVWTGSRMIVWGGSKSSDSGTRIYMSTGATYDPVADAWTSISGAGAPPGRDGASAVWTGTTMIVWGGRAQTGVASDGGRYDAVADQWSPMSSTNAPAPRVNHTAVWSGTEMIVWGGEGGNVGDTPLLTGGRYAPATDSWTPTDTSRAPTPRARHSAVWAGSRMIVWGGTGGSPRGDGATYDPQHDRWKALSTTGAPAPRFGHTSIWTGSRMVIWGGIGAGNAYLSSGGRYDLVSDAWAAMSIAGAPAGRYLHDSVWTGASMVVWGGFGEALELSSGGRYDPVADAWTPTAMPRGPAPRSDAVSAWTGTRFLVWGGWDGAPRGDGGAYDPTLDTWTLMSNLGAPPPRRKHTAVWSGERLIVWGGDVGSIATPTSTGGAYDPTADVWTPTSDAGVPSPRLAHTAIWTGREMIVWGGDVVESGSGNPMNTGGRYDPSTDAWTTTDTTNAPTPRARHAAVWTGREMLVFGGDPPGSYPQGGRYDPAKDLWHPITPIGAPYGISGVPAVWSGKYLVVWNGYGTAQAQRGGRYDPRGDFWLPMSTAPTGNLRSTFAAAWDGREMVVWGGDESNTGNTLGDGARYDPQADTWQSLALPGAPEHRAGHVMAMCGDHLVVWGGRRTASSGNQSFDGDGSRYTLDRNGNGIADTCDLDDDSDGIPDDQDCAPGDPTVASPGAPIDDVRIDGTTMSWSAQDPGTNYDIAWGDLGVLRATGFAETACFASYVPQPSIDPLPAVSPGFGAYYLVRAVNVCAESGWGEPGKPDRPVIACP